jgi:anti-anti-sigma regulatory factor
VKFRSDWLHNQAELKEAMLRIDECAAGQETPDVELDMCEVAHVSSHALGWFLDSARRVAERDGRMHIINAGTPLYSTLSVVQLNEICEIDVPSELETAK